MNCPSKTCTPSASFMCADNITCIQVTSLAENPTNAKYEDFNPWNLIFKRQILKKLFYYLLRETLFIFDRLALNLQLTVSKNYKFCCLESLLCVFVKTRNADNGFL